jgi:hypothetical protein
MVACSWVLTATSDWIRHHPGILHKSEIGILHVSLLILTSSRRRFRTWNNGMRCIHGRAVHARCVRAVPLPSHAWQLASVHISSYRIYVYIYFPFAFSFYIWWFLLGVPMEVYCDLVVVDLYSGFAIENLRCALDLLPLIPFCWLGFSTKLY